MFTYLLYTLLYFTLSRSEELLIKDSGVGFIDEDDIAMLFYVTLENNSLKGFEVSVCMAKCCDTTNPTGIDCNSTALIGGDMGFLDSKRTKNVTLIYPNLYLKHRQGQCTVIIHYRNDAVVRQKMARINFNTIVANEEGCECQSVDMDPSQNCRVVDCVIKYSGTRNYFDAGRMECVPATQCVSPPEQCVPEIGYSISTNNCTNLNTTIGTDDLHLLDSNRSEVSQCTNCPSSNTMCHHGSMNGGQCECDTGWTTTTDEEMYSPTLLVYHMCNVEIGAWNCLNKRKIKTTTILILIFSITITSKILILMCILNWCYRRYRKKKELICSDRLDPTREEIILCVDLQESDECLCEDKLKQKPHFLQTQTVNASNYPGSMEPENCNKCSLNSEESVKLSKTTTSPRDTFEIDSDTASEVTDQVEGEANDEEFSVEGDECSDLEEEEVRTGEYGEGDNKSYVEDCEEMSEESEEQSEFTGHSAYVSRNASSTVPEE